MRSIDDPAALESMGLSLYGPGWQSAMARDLGINDRTVRRWVAGQNPVPEWIGDALIEAQKTRMAYLLQQLMCD